MTRRSGPPCSPTPRGQLFSCPRMHPHNKASTLPVVVRSGRRSSCPLKARKVSGGKSLTPCSPPNATSHARLPTCTYPTFYLLLNTVLLHSFALPPLDCILSSQSFNRVSFSLDQKRTTVLNLKMFRSLRTSRIAGSRRCRAKVAPARKDSRCPPVRSASSQASSRPTPQSSFQWAKSQSAALVRTLLALSYSAFVSLLCKCSPRNSAMRR